MVIPNDPDYPDIRVFGVRYQHAKKQYKCDLCGQPITIGERYQVTPMKNNDEDKFECLRSHVCCPYRED